MTKIKTNLRSFYETYFVEIQTAQITMLFSIFVLLCFGIWNGNRQRNELKQKADIGLRNDDLTKKSINSAIINWEKSYKNLKKSGKKTRFNE